jgi:acetyl-CoA carboxylase biotin carboxylase subunit
MRNFVPTPGKVQFYHAPGGFGIRVDTAVYTGYVVPPFYDSMIAKIIAWAPSRDEAILRMKRALEELKIEGISTNISFHLKIMDNAFFRRGEVYTNFIQRRLFI